MTVQIPSFLQNKGYPAIFWRRMLGDIFGIERVISGLNASYLGPNLQVSVSAGAALVQGDTNANQGLYDVFNDAAVTLTHNSADPSNPRVDRIILQVNDSIEVGSGPDSGALVIVPGTPQSGASLTNSATWPALPATAMEIACVPVGAGVTTLSNAVILDRRPKLSGKSIIATTETLTSVPYGLMATPDIVRQIVVPTDAFLCVAFQATWKETIAGGARAAIFIGANQLKLALGNDQVAGTQAAATTGATASKDHALASGPIGLLSYAAGGAVDYAGDATTGQAVGISAQGAASLVYATDAGGGDTVQNAGPGTTGGHCRIFVAAGTYDVSIQYKMSPGVVTAKNRRLGVWVENPGGPHGGRW